jgi:hypothetical protein
MTAIHHIIKGDGKLDAMLGICKADELPFCVPVDAYLRPAHRTSHLLELTALDIKEAHGGVLTKVKVGDKISIGQFMGDVLPTWSILTDVDVSVTGEPGLVLKMGFTDGFTPTVKYVDRERRTVPTDGTAPVCKYDLAGDLAAIKGEVDGFSGEHLVARFDDLLPANRVLHATRAYFEIVALPAPKPGSPAGTPNGLRGGLHLKLRMNFIDRSYCNKHNACQCGDERVEA